MKEENTLEKILFIYSSQILAGTSASKVNTPEPWIQIFELPTSINLMATFGLLLETNQDYTIDVNIYFDDKSLIPENRASSPALTLNAGITGNKEIVTISSMPMLGIQIFKEGLYKIVATLLNGTTEAINKNTLDNQECYFIVSKSWSRL